MICPACSKEISDTAKVCGYCGTRLGEVAPLDLVPVEAPVPVPEPEPEEPEPESEESESVEVEPEPELASEPVSSEAEPSETRSQCPHCGEDIHPDTRRCPYCKRPVDATAQPAPEPEPEHKPLPTRAVAAAPSRSSRSWMIWVPLTVIAVGVVAFAGIREMLAEDESPGTTIAQATTTDAPVTTAAVVTTSPPVATQPTIASTTTTSAAPGPGFPLLSIDALVGERLALMEFAKIEECEVVGQFELQEGPIDELLCRREATAESGAVYVAHGFHRDEADTVTDLIDLGMWFTLAIDGMEVEPNGYLDRDGVGDPVATWVFFVDLSGSHELVATWYEEGFPIITAITEVVFP